jgi:hypothetical protein
MENEEVNEEIKDLPFGLTDEEYFEIGGDDNDTNKNK